MDITRLLRTSLSFTAMVSLLGCPTSGGAPQESDGSGTAESSGSAGTEHAQDPSEDSAAETPSGGNAESSSCPSDEQPIFITDETNYSFRNTLQVQTTTLKDATDLRFDWGNLTRDFFGQPLNPGEDVDLVLLSLWGMTPAELQENLQNDNLPLGANKGAITYYADATTTSANLLEFDIIGNPLPEDELWKIFDTQHPEFTFPQDTHTFMLTAGTGTQLGRGARMLAFFNLDPASENTELVLGDTTTILDYEARITQAVPVAIPPGTASLEVDWSEMTTNALGNAYSPFQITEAVVANFGARTPDELERNFLELESLAEGWWHGEVLAGTSIELSTLVDASGNPFAGIDDDGLWLLALFCTKDCNNPAPWSLTILQTCAPD